ncbi:MAG: peroxiredoxin family protein [Thermoanaerobaculia bacterium]
MPGPISIGDIAPNFDLSSTENAVLMLRDEVSRTAVVLYFFASPEDERQVRDLEALNAALEKLGRLKARVLAVSPAPLEALRKVQAGRRLLFPLLHDDRGFSASYGVTSDPALVVVGRRQEVRWISNPVAAVEAALPQVEQVLKALPAPTRSYPKSVINGWIDRWVN